MEWKEDILTMTRASSGRAPVPSPFPSLFEQARGSHSCTIILETSLVLGKTESKSAIPLHQISPVGRRTLPGCRATQGRALEPTTQWKSERGSGVNYKILT